ncbi:MAG: hypothetical protein ACI9KE_001396 [Polyangiales bacterium]|jgi:hypothetical protein
MSNERRPLRFLITSALLLGPAMGCGGAEPEPNTTPPDLEPMEDPTGNPLGPEPEPLPLPEPNEHMPEHELEDQEQEPTPNERVPDLDTETQ